MALGVLILDEGCKREADDHLFVLYNAFNAIF